MKVLSSSEYKFSFEEISEILKERLIERRSEIMPDDVLTASHSDGNITIHHDPDEYNGGDYS